MTSALTILLLIVGDTGEFTNGGLLIAWGFFSWNFYAYGFSSDMWPFQFVELKEDGNLLAREVAFWATAGMYFLILATIAWAK